MFVLEPGEPIAAIAESIYLYTLAEPMGIVQKVTMSSTDMAALLTSISEDEAVTAGP